MNLQLNALLGRQLADSELSYQDYTVLAYLTSQPGDRGRVAEMARALGWETSRLSHHVARMVTRGLVVKTQCPTDRRGWFVQVTNRGRSAIEDAAPGHVTTVREHFLDQLTPAQVQQLGAIAGRVLDHLTSVDGCGEG